MRGVVLTHRCDGTSQSRAEAVVELKRDGLFRFDDTVGTELRSTHSLGSVVGSGDDINFRAQPARKRSRLKNGGLIRNG